MNKKFSVAFFDTKRYDKEFFDLVNKDYGFQLKYFTSRLNKDTANLSKGFDSVCAFVHDTIDRATIKILKQNGINLIALRCAGYNNVDLRAAFGNIHIVRVPSYSPHSVAEHTVALMLALNRKIHRAYFRSREGNFSIDGLLGFDMFGKTVGVIGTGKIGRVVIEILKGFGMNILAMDPKPDEEYAKKNGFRYVELTELLEKSDVITLHCPLTPETRYIINEKSIAKMKDGVMIINTGRGELIKTKALIEGLKKGKIGYAGLDVYEEETEYFFEDFSSSTISDDILARLLTFQNVLITSHQGFFTKEALYNIAKITLENIKEYFEGGHLKNEICYKCEEKTCRKKEGKRCFLLDSEKDP
ncbi:MAG: 2-hydroxyacid dehydrogenase [candidate division WOR-3 bacterium]